MLIEKQAGRILKEVGIEFRGDSEALKLFLGEEKINEAVSSKLIFRQVNIP